MKSLRTWESVELIAATRAREMESSPSGVDCAFERGARTTTKSEARELGEASFMIREKGFASVREPDAECFKWLARNCELRTNR